MLQSGGVQVFLIPKEITDLPNLTIEIRIKKKQAIEIQSQFYVLFFKNVYYITAT
jgi:hypothetical protein